MRKALLISALAVVIAILFISTPNGSRSIYGLLSMNGVDESVCPKDLIVVLSGGYNPGPEERYDLLNRETALRVIKGVQLFKECNPRMMVMSGRMMSGKKERQVELMRDLAVELGIPGDKVLLETESINTREHPIYLSKIDIVRPDAEIAVVTSPWHLRRAMIEFHRYFLNAFPVPAYYMSKDFLLTVRDCLPEVDYLTESTLMFRELVGMIWYRLRNLYRG